MKKVLVLLFSLAVLVPCLRAQSETPRTYTLSAELTASQQKATLAVYRDGPRERVEMNTAAGSMTTLFDFDAHKVYWIGWFKPGSCSGGRYLSARAPVDFDPITGSADSLAKLAPGLKRKPIGSETVNGIPARVEQFVVPATTTRPGDFRPTRLWLAEQGNFVVKIEGLGQDGKPMTLFEVKRLSFTAPPAALLAVPANCAVSDSSAMDDTGTIRAHAEANISVQGSGTVDLGKDTAHSSVSVTSSTANAPTRTPANILTAVNLKAVEMPYSGSCGRKLRVTGTITTNGPATVWYRFYSNAGGVDFSGGQDGTVDVAAKGEATMDKDVTFTFVASRPTRQVELRLQAAVQGANGRHGAVTISNVVPFQVTCTSSGGPSAR